MNASNFTAGLAFVDQPRPGAENMTIDQRMLSYAAENNCVVLRLYTWAEPTLSLGYFQKYAERESHPESLSLPAVRRSTGGGAIVHHHDLTYSFAIPNSALPSTIGAAQPIYDCIHDVFVEWLRDQNLLAQKWDQESCPSTPPKGCSFLCFERRSKGDVVAGKSKIMGSAQRRHKGALLQHGSLLISQSHHAPSLLGMTDIQQDSGVDAISMQREILKRLITSIASELRIELEHAAPLWGKEDIATEESRYFSPEWTRRF